MAAQVFQDLIARLEAAGVVAVNAVPQMMDLPSDTPPFFAADFHWTSFGARAAAEALAARLKSEPAYQALEKSTYASRPLGQGTAFSGLRRLLQLSCHKSLPQVVTTAFETEKVDQPEEGALDLFSGGGSDQIALVGTSFSDSEINNFTGFLSEKTGLDVINRALTGGNQFGAIQDYLTSAEFHQNPPAILIWENPVYNSLTRFADQPMRELIAAAQGGCDTQLAPVAEDPLQVALPKGVDPQQTVLVDLGRSSVRRVVLGFETPEGVLRHKSISRSPRQTPAGRFFMPLTGLGPVPEGRIRVQAKGADPSSIRVFLCASGKGDI